MEGTQRERERGGERERERERETRGGRESGGRERESLKTTTQLLIRHHQLVEETAVLLNPSMPIVLIQLDPPLHWLPREREQLE